MGLTVRDLFDLDIMKNFKLIAGEGGLNRPITSAEILDFEFVQGVGLHREQIFNGESIALSSLLFAKDNPSVILDAVIRLYELKVNCLAYKTVFIKQLPEEVIAFANKNDFPILEFGGDEFFEEVILEVTEAINRGSEIDALELQIGRILDKEAEPHEMLRFAKRLNPNLKSYVRAVAVWEEGKDADEIFSMIQKYANLAGIRKKSALCKFKNSYFIILSQDTAEESRFMALLEDILVQLGADQSKMNLGISRIKTLEDGFGKCIEEAFWACIVAQIEKKPRKKYEELGVYRFLVPEIYSPYVKSCAEEFLSPILKEEEHDLLETAKAYVLCSGDVIKTAELLFCHKNTVRYRLAKIQEVIDPANKDKDFYESLSIAIRIYILTQFKK